MDVIGHGEAVSELLELANTLMNNMHEQEAKGVRLLFPGSAASTLRTTDFDVQSKIRRGF